MNIFPIKGCHYRSSVVYNACTFLKLWENYYQRFHIAREYIKEGARVLDVCAGAGTMRYFLPKDCRYTAVDASQEFLSKINKDGAATRCLNLHQGIVAEEFSADIILMIISLCHFRNTSVHALLEDFKKMARKVVFVEDVLLNPRRPDSFIQRTINYLTATDYSVPLQLFTRQEFQDLMKSHGYQYRQHTSRYAVGYYGF